MFQNSQKTAYQTSSNRSKTMKISWFDDVWYAVFCEFWNKVFVYFPQGYWQQSIWFYRDQNGLLKTFFLYATPLRKINKSFVWKLTKNCIPNIIKSINFYGFWQKKASKIFFKKCLVALLSEWKISLYNSKGGQVARKWIPLKNSSVSKIFFKKCLVALL